MIRFPMGFKMDGFNFSDYGSAFTKVLFSQLPKGLQVEVSNTNPPVLKNGEQGEFLEQHIITFELTKEDFRDLNFIAQGFLPEEDGFFAKLIKMIIQDIEKQQQELAMQPGIPIDMQVIVFHGQPFTLEPVSSTEAVLKTTFKVLKND